MPVNHLNITAKLQPLGRYRAASASLPLSLRRVNTWDAARARRLGLPVGNEQVVPRDDRPPGWYVVIRHVDKAWGTCIVPVDWVRWPPVRRLKGQHLAEVERVHSLEKK
jgi:hypothetical protein